jgi:copper chaperone CopZ
MYDLFFPLFFILLNRISNNAVLSDMNQTQKARFKVVGMYCTSCKPIIENQLKGNEAIKNIDIDFMTDSVIVEYDPTLITKERIKERLENSGYKFIRVSR